MESLNLPTLEPHRNLTRTVYDTLKSAIIENTVRPGDRLIEATVASTLGVSTTPVREALTRLEREGLVTLLPRRGAVVCAFGAEDVLEVGYVREILEAGAIRKAVERRTPEAADRLGNIVERGGVAVEAGDHRAFLQIDVEFHRLLVESSGNRRLVRLFAMMHDQLQMMRQRSVQIPGRPPVAQQEHRQIVAAYVAGDADEAERLLRGHIRHAIRDLLATLPPT